MRDSESPSATSSYDFDVFISYNRNDQDVVNAIVAQLREKRINTWFDKTHLLPGSPWRSGAEHGLTKCRSFVAFVGPSGVGKVHQEEIDVAIDRQSKEGTFSVIPVLLPGGCPEDIPPFLSRNTWIDLRNGIDDTETLEKLVKAIRGIPPFKLTSRSEPLELLSTSSEGKSRQRILSIPANDISHALHRASRDLLTWPAELPDGKWLERPEFAVIHDRIKSESPSTILLLGEPGSGKSALLARLAKQMVEDGSPVLGIKADLLPRDVETHDLLAKALRLPALPAECIWTLAPTKRVALFIDQLDALADFVDLHCGRLNVLLDLIVDASGIPNVHVVASCRMFEHNHDPRLRNLKADPITLNLPAWETVERALTEKGFNASGWPEDMREMLRVPQHLRLFQEVSANLPEGEIFHSYHAMLNRVWELKIPDEALELVENMAIQMGEQEDLWLPIARFQKDRDKLRRLESEGILMCHSDRGQIGFRHQTLFEYARARAFVTRESSLAEHVLARQDGLFVRPQLWNALHYSREAGRTGYRREFEMLWTTTGLRSHLRILLIEFLGQLRQPDEQEAAWLLPYLNRPEYRARVLSAMTGSPGWFEQLNRGFLGASMNQSPKQAAEAIPVLQAAWIFARDQVLRRIEEHWLAERERDALTWQVLGNLTDWDERATAVVARILERSEVDAWRVGLIVKSVSASTPERAPRLVAIFLTHQLNQMRNELNEEPEPLPEGASEDERTAHFITHNPRKRFQKLLEFPDLSHNLPVVAEAAPEAFLDAIWPWFLEILGEIAYEPDYFLRIYRQDHSLATNLKGDSEHHHEYSIVSAIETTITQLAMKNNGVFLDFMKRNENVEFLVVQRLLARGLEKLATSYPEAVLNFLISDTRRLMLGNNEDKHSDTKRLISLVAPHLNSQQRRQLETGILSWSQYDHYPEDDDPKTRLDCSKWDREDRLRLWRAFPSDLLTPEIRRHVLEEEQAFPRLKERDRGSSDFRCIGSPMSAEQMAAVKDEEVLSLFAELNDTTGRDHPRYWDKGGKIEAAREFEVFAKTNPDRAVRLIREMQSSKNELAAGHGLVGLAESGYPEQDLFSLIIELDRRGFSSSDFRHETVRACEKLIDKQQLLPEGIDNLLESWLLPAEVAEGEDMSSVDEDAAKREHTASVLWDSGGIRALPHGNFPILSVLTKNCLTKRPADTERWLDILEKHLERSEKVDVWQALAWPYLKHLAFAEKQRAQAFLVNLFRRFPKVRDCREGAFLIADSQRWADSAIVKEWVSELRNSSWTRAAQASAEITMLHHAWFPKAQWASEQVRVILEGSRPSEIAVKEFSYLYRILKNSWQILGDLRSAIKRSRNREDQSVNDTSVELGLKDHTVLQDMRIGIAFSAAHLWGIPRYRALASAAIVKLLPDTNEAVQQAVSDLFRVAEEMPPDEDTRNLLEALCCHPNALATRNAYFLVEHLEDLVTTEPEIVYRVCSAMLEQIGPKVADVQKGWSIRADNFVNIALALQRCAGDSRRNGLALFERLLELDVPNARNTLLELDRRPGYVAPPKPSRRRRRKH